MRHIAEKLAAFAPALLILSGCINAEAQPPVESPGRACEAEAGNDFIGETYREGLAPTLLAATGASSLRAAHLNAPVTMDFIPNRLTVAFNDDGIIVRMTCG